MKMLTIDVSVKEVKVERGIGIWGNTECVQCGACCFEWNNFLCEIEARASKQCEHFEIRDGRAYCSAHEGNRKPICQSYFCGNTDFRVRFAEHGDETLREIAGMLGTIPEHYSIPKLLPRLENDKDLREKLRR